MIVGVDAVLSAHGGTDIVRLARGGMHNALPVCSRVLVGLFVCGGGVVGVSFLVCRGLALG
ncbi:hypothetical protein AB0L65_04290 [Nonomuraea sp. NPDC052116]|uniref:hypothetical protein n=1 Tax=Nonomuraea sp. NPDC052116 TaxID=3155665 RepID=UPI0034304EFC